MKGDETIYSWTAKEGPYIYGEPSTRTSYRLVVGKHGTVAIEYLDGTWQTLQTWQTS